MPDPKPTAILLSKTDLSAEEIAPLSNAEAWQLIYSLRERKAKDERLQVCFTGLGTTQKKELAALANQSGFRIVASVTKGLDYLIGGENAGPKKIEKAEAQGVQYLTKEQFLDLVETGELPSEG